MAQRLLSAALDDAERSAPVVRAAALLHIARVLTVFDHVEAERVLERGIALAEALAEPDREVILGQAVSLAATVSPSRAIGLAPSVQDEMSRGPMTQALFDMVSHGHVAEAVEYLSAVASLDDYPFDAASQAMGRATDDAALLSILRRAVRAMRQQMPSGRSRQMRPAGFSWLFCRWYHLLPVDEATAVVRELASGILAEPEGSIHASFNEVRFSSTHAHRLFEILGPLQRLDPALTASLVRDHPQLAVAAARYPHGHESIETAARGDAAPAASRGRVEQPDAIAVGRRLIPIPEALATDFQEAFDLALRLYAGEVDPNHPNDAPQECWPSAREFRNILYKAGQHEGRAAVRHLERIPDPALRLFAQIELAAALAGLPQMGGRSISPGPYGFRQSMAMRARDRERGPGLVPPFPAVRPRPPARKPDLPPSHDVRIAPTRRTEQDGPSGGSGPDYWVIEGAPLRPVLASLYDLPTTRIDLPASLAYSRYDFVLVLPQPETQEAMIRLMHASIEKHFHVTREIRSMEVDVLTAPNGIKAREAGEDDSLFSFGSIGFTDISQSGPPRIPDGLALLDVMNLRTVPSEKPTMPDDAMRAMKTQFLRAAYGAQRGRMGINSIGQALTTAQLCEVLESGLDRPLLDDTHLSGTYTINAHAQAVNTRDFLQMLCEKLGLVVTPGRRDVSLLVVRPH